MAEKRLLLPPFPLFNVTVMLSRTLTYMLTYNIDLGGWGERESGLTELTKFYKLTLDCGNFKNFEKYIRKCPYDFVQD